MVLNMSVEDILAWLGHDGSEVLWPSLPEPLRRRAFHIQEMIDFSWMLGYSVTPFDACPVSQAHAGSELKVLKLRVPPTVRMSAVMASQPGVITGETPRGQAHAVAWDGHSCQDPNGTTYGVENFRVQTFWAIQSR